MSYMSKKSFHPGSRVNRQKVELSKMNELILQKRIEERNKEIQQEKQMSLLNKLAEKNGIPDVSFAKKPEILAKLDEQDHPERKIPDIPENKRVRDFLRSQPLTGHGAAFGSSIEVVQCYVCKCYGHRAGSPECKYAETGNIGLEMQKRIREDPLTCFKRVKESTSLSSSKVERMKELLEEAKREQQTSPPRRRHKHHHRPHRSHSKSSA